ncbi:mannosyltransferase [Rhinocladiella similis]
MILRSAVRQCLAVLLFLLPFVLCDADFVDVRTNLDRDRSGKRGDPKDKYFHESTFHPHYDGRFAAKEIGKEERLPHLTALMQTFLATMADIGAETWIMHGTLLGWWWNQKILPWDSDIDVQVSEHTIAFLAKYYNMTEYHFKLPGVKNGRTYLMEVNPHFTIRGVEDNLNVIDARWIDTETGLFIDISTVRANYTARAEGVEGALMCKDRHHYLERDIFPLRDSFFEGIHVKIPFEYAYLLEEEYGEKSLTLTVFEHHQFNQTSKLWEPLPSLRRPSRKRPPMKRPPVVPKRPLNDIV